MNHRPLCWPLLVCLSLVVGEFCGNELSKVALAGDGDSDPLSTSLGLTPDSGTLPIWTVPDHDASQQLGDVVRAAQQAVVLVGHPKGGTGTAFVISRKHRLLATNAHVADIFHASRGELFALPNDSETPFRVKTVWYHPGVLRLVAASDGRSRLVQTTDPKVGPIYPRCPDVAVLELHEDDRALPVEIPLASREEVAGAFAQSIALLGYPGHDTPSWPEAGKRPQATFHAGVVSRVSDFQLGNTAPHQFLQHTAANWFGFSGSPLLLPTGHVIGLNNSMRRSEESGFTREIAHGVRIDCLWELLAYHKLDSRVPISVERSELDLARFDKPRPAQPVESQALEHLIQEAYQLVLEGRFEEAAEICSCAIAVDPNCAEPYYWRAEAVRREIQAGRGSETGEQHQERCERAFADYQKAAQLKPSSQVTILSDCARLLCDWSLAAQSQAPELAQRLAELAVGLADKLIPISVRLAAQNASTRISFERLASDETRYWAEVAALYVLRAEAKSCLGDHAGAVADYSLLQSDQLPEQFRGDTHFWYEQDHERNADAHQRRGRAWEMVAQIPPAREDYLFAEQVYRLLAGEAAGRRPRHPRYEDPNDVRRVRDKADDMLRRRLRLEQPRGWLGVSLRAGDDAASESSRDQGLRGVVIDGILDDSPAARSGLKVGDLVVDYDGEAVTEVFQFVRRVGETRPGTTVPVSIIRNGSPQTLKLSIGETVAHNEASFPELGLSVRTLTPSEAQKLGFAAKLRGALVTDVEPGGRAATAGLRVDDVIYSASVSVRANETAYVVQFGDVADVDGVRRMVELGKQQIEIAADAKIPVYISVSFERHARTQHPPRQQVQGWQAVITKTPEGNWRTNVDIYLQP